MRGGERGVGCFDFQPCPQSEYGANNEAKIIINL